MTLVVPTGRCQRWHGHGPQPQTHLITARFDSQMMFSNHPCSEVTSSDIILDFLSYSSRAFLENRGADLPSDAPVRCLVKVGNTGLKILPAAGRMEIRFSDSSLNAQRNSTGVPHELSLRKGNKPQEMSLTELPGAVDAGLLITTGKCLLMSLTKALNYLRGTCNVSQFSVFPWSLCLESSTLLLCHGFFAACRVYCRSAPRGYHNSVASSIIRE